MKVRNNRVNSFNYQDNTTQSLDLPRGQVYREIALHLTGAPTVTAANNIAANLGRAEVWSLLTQISIVVNGSDVIRTFTGDELMVLNYLWYRVQPMRETTYGDGVTANPSFDRILRIPFWSLGLVHPQATLLDARRVDSLQLKVQFGNYASINSAATAWTTSPTLEIYQEYVAPDDPKAPFGPFHTWRSSPMTNQYTNTQKDAQIQLPIGDVYRSFFMNTNVSGTDTTGILNEFRFLSGSLIYFDCTENVLRQKNYVQSGLVDHASAVLSKSTKFNLDAWYYANLMDSGAMHDGIDSLGFAQLALDIDVTGQANANFVVHPQLIIPAGR